MRIPSRRRFGWRVLIGTAVLAVVGCGTVAPDDPVTDPPDVSQAPSNGAGASPAASATGQCEYVQQGRPAKKVEPPPATQVPTSGQVVVTVSLNVGDITMTLDRAKGPCTVNSFLSLVRQGFYVDAPCPRITNKTSFFLQCGDPSESGGPGYVVPDEVSGQEVYAAGTVAMWNPGPPNSGGAQFMVFYSDTDLSPQYTIFGELDPDSIEILKVLAELGIQGTPKSGDGKPTNPITITGISVG